MRTRKNEKVDPDPTLPYLIFVGLVAKVFQDNLMSESMRPTVRIKKKKKLTANCNGQCGNEEIMIESEGPHQPSGQPPVSGRRRPVMKQQMKLIFVLL